MLERLKLITGIFIDVSIEVNYRFALPLLVFWGISGTTSTLFLFSSVWLLLWFFPLFLLGILTLIAFEKEKDFQSIKNFLRISLRILLPLVLSVGSYFLTSMVFAQICILMLVIIPSIDFFIKAVLAVRPIELGNFWTGMKFYLIELFSHPVLIVGGLGLVFVYSNFWFKALLDNTINFIYPAVLPICLIVAGAKLGQIITLAGLRNFLNK